MNFSNKQKLKKKIENEKRLKNIIGEEKENNIDKIEFITTS